MGLIQGLGPLEEDLRAQQPDPQKAKEKIFAGPPHEALDVGKTPIVVIQL